MSYEENDLQEYFESVEVKDVDVVNLEDMELEYVDIPIEDPLAGYRDRDAPREIVRLPVEPTAFDDYFRYDLTIVFDSPETDLTYDVGCKEHGERVVARKEVVDRLRAAGLTVQLFYSRDRDQIFCKVGATEKRLKLQAARDDYLVQLRNTAPYYGVFTEFHIADSGKRPLWDLVKFYTVTDQLGRQFYSPFRPKDRIRLLQHIIETQRSFHGAGFDLDQLVDNEKISSFFYVHDLQEQQRLNLAASWASWSRFFSYQPVDEVRFYFGESISLYFAFLGFYSSSLMLPAFFGICLAVFFSLREYDTEDRSYEILQAGFALFISLWAAMFLERWKRYQSILTVKWGTSNFEAEERQRFQFWGTQRRSPVDDELELFYPPMRRMARAAVSWTAITALILAVIIAVLGLLVQKAALEEVGLGWTLGAITMIQIMILNAVYSGLAKILNDLENHRTETSYNDFLIAKTFLFQFVNSYNSLFFIAFIKPNDVPIFDTKQSCDQAGCINELRVQLAAMFLTALTVNNVLELLMPYVRMHALRMYEETELSDEAALSHGADSPRVQLQKWSVEWQSKMQPYGTTLADFSELTIQYGYVTLFVAAFPLAPFLALLSNAAELRVDAKKLLFLTQRPFPTSAQDIGTWYIVLEIMGVLAVFTNMGLVTFQSSALDYFYGDSETRRVWTFIIGSGAILLFKILIDVAVPDFPEVANTLLKRQQYIVERFIYGVTESDTIGLLDSDPRDALKELGDIPHHDPSPLVFDKLSLKSSIAEATSPRSDPSAALDAESSTAGAVTVEVAAV